MALTQCPARDTPASSILTSRQGDSRQHPPAARTSHPPELPSPTNEHRLAAIKKEMA
jgi:hypothetical protein